MVQGIQGTSTPVAFDNLHLVMAHNEALHVVLQDVLLLGHILEALQDPVWGYVNSVHLCHHLVPQWGHEVREARQLLLLGVQDKAIHMVLEEEDHHPEFIRIEVHHVTECLVGVGYIYHISLPRLLIYDTRVMHHSLLEPIHSIIQPLLLPC